jgi:hypothetical protein
LGALCVFIGSFYFIKKNNQDNSGRYIDWTGSSTGTNVNLLVTNDSGQKLEEIKLKHYSDSIMVKNVQQGETVNLGFKVTGEASYKLSAVLNEGKVLSTQQYVEPGYTIRETIYADSIGTNFDPY